MLDRLRRYEVQAVWALALALVSLPPAAAAAWLAMRNYNSELGRIVYGAGGRFILTFAACVLVSLGISGLGFILGWNSAGQPRNDRSGASWAGFFVGGLAVSANIILLLAFYMLQLKLE